MLLRLHPSPATEVSVEQAYDVERPAPTGRPWLGVCMVSSLDGSTVVDGRSAALSSENDTSVLLTLRRLADVIIVGAGTVRAEGYGVPRTPGQRIGVVTNSGEVDTSIALFTSGAGFLILPEGAPSVDVDTLRVGRDRVDLAAAIARLGEVSPGVRFVQAEGGPVLNGSLLDADLVDELNLTISPQLVGGTGPRLTAGAAPAGARYELAHLLTDDESFLFTRWVRRRAC